MEAVNFITDYISYLLIVIPVSAAAMITYQASRKTYATDDETISEANNKIRQTIKGAIICTTISGIITIMKKFYM